jgi:hypothetical protein
VGGELQLSARIECGRSIRYSAKASPMLLFDLRFSVLSFFLIWAALLLTCVAVLLYVRGLPPRQTLVVGAAALALWTAGALVPVLT